MHCALRIIYVSLRRYREVRRHLNKKNNKIILFCLRFALSLALPKILSFDNKKIAFYFVLCSFNRIFAAAIKH